MIKKIKITNHNEYVLRDTTIGKVYDVTVHEGGSLDINDDVSIHDTLCLIDDVGDRVALWTHNDVYEVVEEDSSMTNNNQVNWDEIPEDVEAVLSFTNAEDNYYKEVDSKLYEQTFRTNEYRRSGFSYKDIKNTFGDRFHLRPTPTPQPTPEPPESTQVESPEVEATTTPEFDWSSVEDDVEAVVLYPDSPTDFYKYIDGKLYVQFSRDERYFRSDYDAVSEIFGDYDEGRVFIRPLTVEPPSISTILQEAQQSILKHHGVTGKVKFTVTCSE